MDGTEQAPGTREGAGVLDTIGHGTLLSDRYRLAQRVRHDRDGGTWRGVDEVTERPVSILILSPDHPHLADVVDAALRATDLDDPRLVRILAAGHEPVSYVVTERIVGRDLPRLLSDGPLPAESARRVVGETALALVSASRSGLHHLRLGPRSVVVRPDGRVVLNGLAINAAAVGIEEPDADLAERADAVGLIRLLYASLTCRWPNQAVAGLAAAPRIAGGPVAPGDLVAGVPADLDALCVQTLALGGGPRTPSAVVDRLGSWDKEGRLDAWLSLDTKVPPLSAQAPAVRRPAAGITSDGLAAPAANGEPAVGSALAAGGTAGPAIPGGSADRGSADRGDAAGMTAEIPATRLSDALAGAVDTLPSESADTAGRSDADGRSDTDGRSADSARPGASAQARGSGRTVPAAGTIAGAVPPAVTAALAGAASAVAAAATAAAQGVARAARAATWPRDLPEATSAAGDVVPATGRELPAGPAVQPTTPQPALPGRAATEPPAVPPTAAGPAAHLTATEPAAQPTATQPTATQPTATQPTAAEPTATRPVAQPPAVLPQTTQALTPSTWQPPAVPGLNEVLPDREPLGALLPAQPSLPRDQTRILLAVVAAVLLVGFVFAVQTVAEVGRSSASFFEDEQGAVIIPPPQKKKPVAGAAKPTKPATSPTKAARKPATGPAPSITGIQAIDPLGDGDENGARAPKAIDDDPDSTWRSARYASAEFGGLKKALGLVIELKQPAAVKTVQLRVAGSGGVVEVRTAQDPDIEGSKRVAVGSIENGKATINVKQPRPSRYVILWFTQLPRADGEYRLDVSEIEVR